MQSDGALRVLVSAAALKLVICERDCSLQVLGRLTNSAQAKRVGKRQACRATTVLVQAGDKRQLKERQGLLDVLGAIAGAAVKQHDGQVEQDRRARLVVLRVEEIECLLVVCDGILD